MDYQYVGYTEDRKIVKGTLAAVSQEVAIQTLSRQGCQVLSLKPASTFVPSLEKAFPSLFRCKPEELVLFSRQLALLLESGSDIVTSLELLRSQAPNRILKRVLTDVVADLRGGHRLSVALDKHPQVFPAIYRRSLGVGERTGSLETVLRQVADYMEKEATTTKMVKNAMTYPVIVSVLAVGVIVVLFTFVLPAFTGLYSSLNVELPLPTRMLLAIVDVFGNYGIYILIALLVGAALAFIYIRTPTGGYQWDKLSLRMPLLGRVNLLNELARCCRNMSLLLRAGLPLPEIMSLVIEASGNKVVREALTGVEYNMLKGEGLSPPMTENGVFLPMMVQMVRVGEETGNLDITLLAVAESYETEAASKTRSLVSLIQPVMTVVIGSVVAFVALSMVSAMYSIYGQLM